MGPPPQGRSGATTAPGLVDHFFRREYGRLVAILTRKVGVHHLDVVEDRERVRIGAEWLERSATGDVFSRFHAEAGIAAEHCFAPSFVETRWKEIADLYATLEGIEPSPLHTMNRAVAVAEWQGADAGLAVLEAVAPPAWLARSYLWDAVLCDLHRRAGHLEIARRHRDGALTSAPTDAVRDLLRRRLAIPA